MKLPFEKYQAARNYIMTDGRDLEQELFRFHFENGSNKAVIDALKNYQSEDGGFKNMGEGHVDFTNAMDTSMAFQYLSEVGATSEEEIVQKGIKYITNSYDQSLKCWHARYDERASEWDNNPCSELLGYLYEYRELVPSDFLSSVTEQALSAFRNPKQPYDFLKALCLFRLAERIDEPFKSEILDWLNTKIFKIIEIDSSKWATTYSAKPFFFAHSAKSHLYEKIREHVIQSLESEVLTQSETGNFILNWTVQDTESERVWKSIWTMDALRALHHHDMISK